MERGAPADVGEGDGDVPVPALVEVAGLEPPVPDDEPDGFKPGLGAEELVGEVGEEEVLKVDEFVGGKPAAARID